MARRYKKSRRLSQKQYRSRLAKYEAYRSSTLEPKSYKEWNEPYRQDKFLRKEYKLYKERFASRQKSARFGFRKIEGEDVKPYETFNKFKNQYLLTRNSLKEEVDMGERERVGSVITEMINDQAYELSSIKASAVADYLKSEQKDLLIKKKLGNYIINDKGEEEFIITKKRNFILLIRQGQFVEEEVGLWDNIKNYYKTLIDEGYTSTEAKKQIGKTYFKSE